MYVWAAFEAKSPPTHQDLVTLMPNSSLEYNTMYFDRNIDLSEKIRMAKKK